MSVIHVFPDRTSDWGCLDRSLRELALCMKDVQCSVSFEPVVIFFCRVFGKLLLCGNRYFSAAASWAPRGVECVCMSWQHSAFLVYYEQWTC